MADKKSQEFIRSAVQLVQSGQTIQEVARQLKIAQRTLKGWVNTAHQMPPLFSADLGSPLQSSEGPMPLDPTQTGDGTYASANADETARQEPDKAVASGTNGSTYEDAGSPTGVPPTNHENTDSRADRADPGGTEILAPSAEGSKPLDSAKTGDGISAGAGAEKTAQPVPDIAPASGTNRSLLVDAVSLTWLLATNHLNMAYMLSAGMLMGPAGFGGKYYRDPAGVFPGWLPLFRNDVPETALESSVSERKDLRRCIAEIDIKQISGSLRLVTRDGEIRDISLPAEIDGEVAALLVSAPLPLTLVTRLRFCSEEDRKEFERVARDVATGDMARIPVEVFGQSSCGAFQMTWPPVRDRAFVAHAIDDKPPARGQAIGGVLAMLYHLANRSDLCYSAYRVIANDSTESNNDTIKYDPVLKELPHWLASGDISADAPAHARLYWGVAQALVDARLSHSTSKPIDTVLEYLDSQLAVVKDPDLRYRLDKLIRTMKGAFGMAKGTNSDFLKQHPGSLSRPLLLLCLRERCKDLLEFSHSELKDKELVLAAILFGIREGGWRNLPSELRRPDALANYAMHRMCEIEQKGRDIGSVALGSEPPRPKPLRELIHKDDRDWSTSLTDAVVGFARHHGWSDCIVTRINLTRCSYDLKSSPTGVEIVVHGDILHSIEVDKDSLLKRISWWPPLTAENEDKLRNLLR